jgi:hypothetical protein
MYRGRVFTVQTSGLMAIQGVSIALAGVVGTFVKPNLTIALAGLLGTAITLLIARRALGLRAGSDGIRPGVIGADQVS